MAVLAILTSILCSFPSTDALAETGRRVFSEVYRAPVSSKVAGRQAVARKGLLKSKTPLPVIELPPLNTAEVARQNRQGKSRRGRVGIGRQVPPPWNRSIDLALMDWEQLATGEALAAFSLRSPGAGALRLCLSPQRLDPGVEFRFYDPRYPTAVVGSVTGADILRTVSFQQGAETTACYWTPVIEYEQIAVEILLPVGVVPAQVKFSIPTVSHLRSPVTPNARKALEELGSSGFCNNDIQCYAAEWGKVADSVAKYIVTDIFSDTFLCTGTLLNDLDTTTQIPYFLTAQHCVVDQGEASSMEFYWFFEPAQCFGADPTTVISQSGGATLLESDLSNDSAFLRLNQLPADGVVFSGWDADPITPGIAVTGIHHPSGDLKKISFGTAEGLSAEGGSVDGSGSFIRTRWNSGVTEQGSSGSGIWITDQGEQLLVGTLTSGFSSCSKSSSPDWYGRFDLTYKSVRGYLEKQPIVTARLTNISTRGLVDAGTDTMIIGFVISGDQGTKRFLIRADAPGLAAHGVSGTLQDPNIQLFDQLSKRLLASNDDWQDGAGATELIDLGLQPGFPEESAFIIELGVGTYTAHLTGHQAGIALFSVTEVDQDGQSDVYLSNISTRAMVGTGAEQLIAGFTVSGDGESGTFLIGAGGPVLEDAGVDGVLQDPYVQLHDTQNSTIIHSNDNWQEDASAPVLIATGNTADYPSEPRFIERLSKGTFTANVTGVNATTGRAIVAVTEISVTE